MSPDPHGEAVLDCHLDRQTEPLFYRDGETRVEHPIEAFYLGTYEPEGAFGDWLESRLDGPLLDVGAGAGRHALYFQERFETVALEVSEALVETMRERGVDRPHLGDMFALRESFERDRFRSVLAIGTQLGLTGSMPGLRTFLCDLAHVTTPDATAVLDCYDPRHAPNRELLGWREDPDPGLASRVMTPEYEGEVGETLLFRYFSPAKLRAATVGTEWTVEDVRGGADAGDAQWVAALEKR